MARNAHTTGERIEELLAGLQAGPSRDTAEELVRLLVEMYGEGLTRIVAELDPGQLTRLADDDVVEGLLLLHDLHPLDVDSRVQRALDRIRPYLGSHAGGVEYLGVEDGVARLRLQGSCDGCASSTLTVKMAIEGAVCEAAPELSGIEVAGVVEPAAPVLQVGMGPPPGWHAPSDEGGEGGWVPLPDLGPPSVRPVAVELNGVAVVVCAVRGTLYAYRDGCAACGSSLAEGALDGAALACPSCGARFDVRLAGRGLDGATHHLEPLPLLSDGAGVRVAVPVAS
ncbi:NifU family protein [Actinophytocola sp.]|uniref:NifU family protein n=1 Tax=Actinophytocola sp. TaxID=1872138 RepID=UPI002D39A072|nr:NifU family protein [Actinophytocola sp.]HYQ65073.1 NifU family protein [Actinophytocola sp.]